MCVLAFVFFLTDPQLAIDLNKSLEAHGIEILETRYKELRPQGAKPDDEAQLNDWAYWLLRQGKVDEAIKVFKLNLKLFPEKANTHDSLAEAYLKAGEVDLSIPLYSKAFEMNKSRETWNSLGAALKAKNDPKALIEWATKGIQIFDDWESHDFYLSLKLKYNQIADPLKSFRTLQQQFPKRGLWRSRVALAQRGIETPTTKNDLQISSYKAFGLDPKPFQDLVEEAKSGRWEKLDAVLVVKREKIIGEAYFRGLTPYRLHDTRSVGKSITALIAGAAIDRGIISLDQKVFDIFPEYRESPTWTDQKDDIKLIHLMAMSSGLDAFDNRDNSPGNENNFQNGPKNWLHYVLSEVPIAFEPGEKLVYASANYLLVGSMIDRATGDMAAFADRHIFGPLGVTDYQWFQTPQSKAYGAGGIRMTPRDLAKMGLIILNKGNWRGKQIISKDWIKEISTPRSDERLWNKQYGLGWYIQKVSTQAGEIMVISAAGNGGQRIWVIPHLDAVVVATMSNYNSRKQSKVDELFATIILPSLLN